MLSEVSPVNTLKYRSPASTELLLIPKVSPLVPAAFVTKLADNWPKSLILVTMTL